MTGRFVKYLQRFKRGEDGNPTIEFVVMTPLLFTIFITAMELGIFSMRQMWLDRGLDIAMRQVRLNTASIPTHNALKQTICANAGFLPDCMNSVKIEMKKTDPKNFAGLDRDADCIDQGLPIASNEKLRNYQTGKEHELMLIRACLKFDPVFPSTGLGFRFAKDGSGQVIMSAKSAFVQEPPLKSNEDSQDVVAEAETGI
ncbi:MAG: TadE family protein [Roseobacter sp.]